jgi:hypothetical protein
VPGSISALEAQRTRVLQEFLGLGDLRPGSITATRRLCGKPTCHCARPNDLGHDPRFRLTRKVKSKTVNESFPSPATLRKAQQEVAEFHRLQKLTDELIVLNQKICELRPVEQEPGGWSAQEKKPAAALHQEISREINAWLTRIFAERRRTGQTDLEAVEMGLRATLHQVGAAALQQLCITKKRLGINARGLALAASRCTTWNYVPNVCSAFWERWN